jgi:hypothetical protein
VWSAASEGWSLYLGAAEAAVTGPDGDVAQSSHSRLEDAIAWGVAHIAGARSHWRRPRVRVWLSGALARPFLCGPVAGLARWAEAQALATAAAGAGTGLERPCEVQLEGWPGSTSVLAVAVEAATLRALEAAAREAGVVLRSVRPWWASALHAACTQPAAPRLLAVTEADCMTVIGGTDGGFELARSVVPKPAEDDAAHLLARLTLTQGIASEQVAMAACELDVGDDIAAWPSPRWGGAARGAA